MGYEPTYNPNTDTYDQPRVYVSMVMDIESVKDDLHDAFKYAAEANFGVLASRPPLFESFWDADLRGVNTLNSYFQPRDFARGGIVKASKELPVFGEIPAVGPNFFKGLPEVGDKIGDATITAMRIDGLNVTATAVDSNGFTLEAPWSYLKGYLEARAHAVALAEERAYNMVMFGAPYPETLGIAEWWTVESSERKANGDLALQMVSTPAQVGKSRFSRKFTGLESIRSDRAWPEWVTSKKEGVK
jgi:hypothetical protein